MLFANYWRKEGQVSRKRGSQTEVYGVSNDAPVTVHKGSTFSPRKPNIWIFCKPYLVDKCIPLQKGFWFAKLKPKFLIKRRARKIQKDIER